MIDKEIIKKLKNEKHEELENKLKTLGERILVDTENLTFNEIESNYTEVEDSSERIKMLGQKIQTLIQETEQKNNEA